MTKTVSTLLAALVAVIGIATVVYHVVYDTSEITVYAKKKKEKGDDEGGCGSAKDKKGCREERSKANDAREKKEHAEAEERRRKRAEDRGAISCSKRNDCPNCEVKNCTGSVNAGSGYHECSEKEKAHGKGVSIACGGSGCDDVGAATCSNSASVCEDSSEEDCECAEVSCPVPVPPTKFITTQVSGGKGVKCGSGGAKACSSSAYDCSPTYKNTPPTCTIAPASISMNRTDAPKQFAITVTDKDYGDTVQVKSVRVVDAQGKLKSCVGVQTLGGGSIYNLTVKTGSNNPAEISMTTNLLADARSVHGIFSAQNNGTSLCSGFLEVEIADVDSDQNGPDVSDTATCRTGISVLNNDPVVSNVTIEDRDPITSLRQTGNLLDSASATSPLYVGSSWDARRVGYCNDAISLDTLGACNSSNFVPTTTRKNPFLLSMTVTDADGIKDIKEMGFWLQRSDATANAETYPLVTTTGRQSIQALIGARQDNELSGKSYYNDNACVGPSCSSDFTQTSSLLGMTLISLKGSKVQNNGTVSASNQRRAWFANWLLKGWPDCYAGTIGCSGDNVPTTATTVTADVADYANYDWMQSADTSHMMCLSGSANTATVVPVSATCPSNCAACVALTSLTKLTDGVSARASFMVTMNDKYVNGGTTQAMAEGRYELLVEAQDKVGGNANGAYAYKPVTNGAGRIPLVFDAQPPTVVLNVTNPANTSYMKAAGTVNDVGPSASGIGGLSTRYFIKETYANPEDITGVLSFLNKNEDGTGGVWDGKNDMVPSATSGSQNFSYNGYGLVGGEGIAAGMCTYDRAGNMCCALTINSEVTSTCANYGTQGIYGYGTPWLQTSLGSVYSNKSSNGVAFNMTVPETSANTSSLLSGAFATQSGSAVSSLVVSNSSAIGIIGGRNFNNTYYPLGFSADSSIGNYRTVDAVSAFNISSIGGTPKDEWYPTLFALASKYCSVAGGCTNSANINDVNGENKQKIIVLKAPQTVSQNLVCKGANLVFITGNVTVTIEGQVTKSSPASGCMFIVDNGATLIVQDKASGAVSGAPVVDRFDAAVVVSKGGKFQSKGIQTLKNIIHDRLEWQGFLFDDSGSAPKLNRRLLTEDNKKYPAEWIIYDANALDVFRPMLGFERTVDVVCGTSSHILCQGK